MSVNLELHRKHFEQDRFATEGIGAVIEEADNGFARCSMDILPEHCNALGILMGGAIYTLADFAFAAASNQNGRAVVTQNSAINFLKPPAGKKLIAQANCVKDGRSTCFYQVDVTDELGTQVAFVTVNGFVVKNPKA